MKKKRRKKNNYTTEMRSIVFYITYKRNYLL